MITTPDSKASPPQAAAQQQASNQWQGPYRDDPTSPPAYNQHQVPPQHQHLPVPVVHYAVVQQRRSVWKRFCKALALAVVAWVLLSILIKSTVDVARWGFGGYHGEYKWPTFSDVDLHDCVLGDDWKTTDGSGGWRYHAETQFDLPLSSETLFLLSRGYNLGGVVKMETSHNQKSDKATVQVKISYRDRFDIDKTKACLLTRGEGENGVGVFTPEWHRDYYRELHSVNFEATVILPEGSKPLTIKNFETDILNGRHQISNLLDKVYFDTISLKGTNGGISAEHLTAANGKFKTTNGGISGEFNSTENLIVDTTNGHIQGLYATRNNLVLGTTNGPVNVDISLESIDDHKVSLNAHTTNGKFEGHINLLSESENGGNYGVKTSTSNGPLKLEFPVSPYDSLLNLDAKTTNGAIDVSLHPAYEGTFDLRSTLFKPNVDIDHNVEDPSGRGRKRSVSVRGTTKTSVKGDVSWDSNHKSKGTVNVKTSSSPLTLHI